MLGFFQNPFEKGFWTPKTFLYFGLIMGEDITSTFARTRILRGHMLKTDIAPADLGPPLQAPNGH